MAQDKVTGIEPITLEQAKSLSYRQTLYHCTQRNADGSALRARVNGKPRTWKRSPERVIVPLKYGLRHCFSITERELENWLLQDPTNKS